MVRSTPFRSFLDEWCLVGHSGQDATEPRTDENRWILDFSDSQIAYVDMK